MVTYQDENWCFSPEESHKNDNPNSPTRRKRQKNNATTFSTTDNVRVRVIV